MRVYVLKGPLPFGLIGTVDEIRQVRNLFGPAMRGYQVLGYFYGDASMAAEVRHILEPNIPTSAEVLTVQTGSEKWEQLAGLLREWDERADAEVLGVKGTGRRAEPPPARLSSLKSRLQARPRTVASDLSNA
jgi:hypothetical protein